MYDYLDLRQTKRLKELVPYKALAPDTDEIIKELDRLNNIIKEAIKYINSFGGEWKNYSLYYGEIMNNLLNILTLKENK